MEQYNLRFFGAILFSALIAIILTLIPLPLKIEAWQPEWYALMLIHWAVILPRKSSYLLAWSGGLLIDIAFGTLLGQHALGMIIVLFLSLRLSARMFPRTLTQQLSLIFFALAPYLVINLWILGATDNRPDWSYWFSLLSSLLIWPFFHYAMRLFYQNKKEF